MFECSLCGDQVPEKDKEIHESFYCKVSLYVRKPRNLRKPRNSRKKNMFCPDTSYMQPQVPVDVGSYSKPSVIKQSYSSRHLPKFYPPIVGRGTYHRRSLYAQRPPGGSSNILKHSTQTESSELLPTKDKGTNTGGSSNILERSTQTESSELLPTKDKSTNTDEEPVKLLETLSNDFSTFYESNNDNDCILKVNKTQFPAHRAVLSARSTVFSAMFHHDTAENRSGEVDIPDVDATTLSDVLYYIYSGKIRGLTADSAVYMYNVTDKYALLELREKCMDFLKLNLTMDNICDAAVLAHAHGETGLEERVLLFIEDRLEELVQSEKWNELLGIKPILASKLLSKAFVASKKRCIQGKSEKKSE